MIALTPRQRDCLGLAAEGLTNPIIAHRLGLSEQTVKNHLHAAYDRLRLGGLDLGAKPRQSAVRYATSSGQISVEG